MGINSPLVPAAGKIFLTGEDWSPKNLSTPPEIPALKTNGPRLALSGIFCLLLIGMQMSFALAETAEDEDVVQALPSIAPVVDGFAETTWDSVTAYTSEVTAGPRFELKAKLNGSHLYFLVTIQINTHLASEYVGLVFSNSSRDTEDAFIDVKRMGLDNATADYHLVSTTAGYNPDTNETQDETEALMCRASYYPQPEIHNWTVYECRVPLASNDTEDAKLIIGRQYAAKIGFGNGSALGDLRTSPPFTLKVGAQEGESNIDVSGEYEFDWNIFAVVVFVVIVTIYAGIGAMIVQSRKSVDPEALKRQFGSKKTSNEETDRARDAEKLSAESPSAGEGGKAANEN